MNFRRHLVPSMKNLRDLGGYPCDGGMTRYGVFFRSDLPETVEAAERLRDGLHITDIIDLRSSSEKERRPNGALDIPGLIWHDNMLFDDLDPHTELQVNQSAAALYIELLKTAGDRIAKAAELMIAAKGAALIHCAVGKDRTGVLAALILECVGVSDVDIVADYQVSFTYIKEKFAEHLKNYPERADGILNSRPENMEKTLEYLRENYGGGAEYLKKHGLPEAALERLRHRFIEKI